jgi:FkbM family methyltransferase
MQASIDQRTQDMQSEVLNKMIGFEALAAAQGEQMLAELAQLGIAQSQGEGRLEVLLKNWQDESEASAASRDAQFRSQLALRTADAESMSEEREARLNAQLALFSERLESQAHQQDVELTLSSAAQFQHFEEQLGRLPDLLERSSEAQERRLLEKLTHAIDEAAAAAAGRDAQQRSQLAVHDAEFEAAARAQATLLHEAIVQRLESGDAVAAERESRLGQQIALSFNAAEAAAQVLHAELKAAFNQLTTKTESHMTAASAAASAAAAVAAAGVARAGVATPTPGANVDYARRMDRLQNDLEFVKNHMSSYLGAGTGLTHLVDETPIYINTNDFGCPANFVNGGRYEEEYYAILATFRRPESVFLDIGANLGVFSLRMSPLIRKGHVHAFEPNTAIRTLFSRSVHLNGLADLVTIHEVGASDSDQHLVLSIPEAHAGGASVMVPGADVVGLAIEVKRIDGVLANLPGFDIAKIDVEGHELSALRGMSGLLTRSPHPVVLFEKLNVNSGIEGDLVEFFAQHEMRVYRIEGSTLQPVAADAFAAASSYFLAARPSTIGSEYNRNFLDIYPGDMYGIAAKLEDGALWVDEAAGQGRLFFHGPYWYLPRGTYQMTVDGEFLTDTLLTVCECFGYSIAEFVVSEAVNSFRLVVERDLTKFEVVGRGVQDACRFTLRKIRFTRIG